MNIKGLKNITGSIFLLVVILILYSCRFNRQTAQYPVIYPDHHQKSYAWAIKKNKVHQHDKATKDTTRINHGSISPYEIIPRSGINLTSLLDSAHAILMPIIHKSSTRDRVNDPELLTASLSHEPLILIHPLPPDTTKINTTSTADSLYIRNAKSPPTYINRIGSTELTKEKTNSNIFAIVSFVSALLIIPSFLAGGSLGVIASLAALIFGILGLKSNKKPLAIAGLLISISTLLLLLILIVYISTAPQ